MSLPVLTAKEGRYLDTLRQIKNEGGVFGNVSWRITDSTEALHTLGFVSKTLRPKQTDKGNRQTNFFTLSAEGEELLIQFEKFETGRLDNDPAKANRLLHLWAVAEPERVTEFVIRAALKGYDIRGIIDLAPQPQTPQLAALLALFTFVTPHETPAPDGSLFAEGRYVGTRPSAFDLGNMAIIDQWLASKGIKGGDTAVVQAALMVAAAVLSMDMQLATRTIS